MLRKIKIIVATIILIAGYIILFWGLPNYINTADMIYIERVAMVHSTVALAGVFAFLIVWSVITILHRK